MKKPMLALNLVVLAVAAFAAAPAPKKNLTPEEKAAARQKFEEMKLKHFGGNLIDARARKGAVTVVNAQQAVPVDFVESVVKTFAEGIRIGYRIEPGAFDLSKPAKRGEATLFIIDDEKLPMSLVAPEAGWAMMNVAPLKTEKQPFFLARASKMAVRSLAYLLGAADSQYPMCLLGCVTKPEDLDKFVDVRLPMDVLARFEKYVTGYGIKPYRVTTYRTAVQEGWAPAPANEYQRKIWDEMHELPSEPKVIKPEKHPAK